MSTPASTIVVVGREAFSPTPDTVRQIVSRSGDAPRLVVVDGGSPPEVQRQLDALASEHDYTLIRHDALLGANAARNLAMEHVATEFTALVDNDLLVDAGWLDGLERCARETRAGAVVPVVLWGPTGSEEIHFAGGTCHIEGEPGARRLVTRNVRMHQPVEALAALTRERSELLELHCLLVRTEALVAIGPFDESLVGGRDEADLALRLAAVHHSVWLEPAVVVGYPSPKRLHRSDRAHYRTRWSDAWATRSFAAFNAKWQLDDTEIDETFLRGHLGRRVGQWPGGGPGRRWGEKLAWKGRRTLDLVVTPLTARAEDRRRARARPPRTTNRASWDVVEPR